MTKQQNISIDQGYSQGVVELYDSSESHIRIGSIDNNTLPITIIIPRQNTQEQLNINLTYSTSWSTSVDTTNNITFYEENNRYDTYASTQFGTLMKLYRNNNDVARNIGNDLDIMSPMSKRYGIITLNG